MVYTFWREMTSKSSSEDAASKVLDKTDKIQSFKGLLHLAYCEEFKATIVSEMIKDREKTEPRKHYNLRKRVKGRRNISCLSKKDINVRSYELRGHKCHSFGKCLEKQLHLSVMDRLEISCINTFKRRFPIYQFVCNFIDTKTDFHK